MPISNQPFVAESADAGIPWADYTAAKDPSDALKALQDGLSVGLIATPRNVLETCVRGEEIAVVAERNRSDAFDFLPVTEQDDDRIIGLIEIAPFLQGAEARGNVEEKMLRLSEENIIGADASILAFIRDADRQRCRLVISGPQISGLVSLSDLQQLPVRAALFGMVTHLEVTMAKCIRRKFGADEEWAESLPPGREAKLLERISQAKQQDSFVDALLLTEFSDKVTIIKRIKGFPWARRTFESNLAQIQSLRDGLAHANDYAATRQAAIRVCETVRLMDVWIESLTAW